MDNRKLPLLVLVSSYLPVKTEKGVCFLVAARVYLLTCCSKLWCKQVRISLGMSVEGLITVRYCGMDLWQFGLGQQSPPKA